MAASKATSLTSLYGELSKFIKSGDNERVVKTANKILQEAPQEEEAFHCKIVSLIHLTKFGEALQVLSKPTKFTTPFTLEKAYCHYRLNKPQAALDVIDADPNPTVAISELRAQVLYRLEKYDECLKCYHHVIKEVSDDYGEERETNVAAVQANLGVIPSASGQPTFEMCYNTACSMLVSGKVIDAEKKLREAEAKCRESLEEEGLAEEDIEDEAAIIKVQLAYCLHRQGREREALAIYQSVLKGRPSDSILVAVASNNIVAINREQNVFDSKKRMKAAISVASTPETESKLTTAQSRLITKNQGLLALHTGQAELCRQTAIQLERKHKDSCTALLLKAALLAKEKKSDAAVQLLLSSKTDKLRLRAAAAHLLLSENRAGEATDIIADLSGDTNDKYRSGIVSALVCLHVAAGRRGEASRVLREAVQWHKNNTSEKSSKSALAALWQEASAFHLRLGDAKSAAECLEELRQARPNDRRTIARLVVAYAKFDPAKAQALSSSLPPLESGAVAAIDVNLLESASWAHRPAKRAAVAASKGSTPTSPKTGSTPGLVAEENLEARRKKKKKRRIRLPKNYDPTSPGKPDPERWLPRRDRTNTNHRLLPGRGKKTQKKGMDVRKGTQGAAGGSASDQYDITKMTPSSSQLPQQTEQSSSSAPRWQRKNQKKKKGGK